MLHFSEAKRNNPERSTANNIPLGNNNPFPIEGIVESKVKNENIVWDENTWVCVKTLFKLSNILFLYFVQKSFNVYFKIRFVI